ncbi:folylpolyglutamate synthase [Coemansia javaensis]|uniref:Folylpolyglutamate synthase n=1 Tax=Coemansia javaensis TaxID=2761396 RepID=A0A9W8HEK3_9FUNG|nr:folylpolyglutamate synthase [Coemansia javaensis]
MTAAGQPGAITLGTERIARFLSEVLPHDPRAKLRVVHVAGTNGKGSVCALVSEALAAAGYRVGTFNSPHFLEPSDAVRLQGAPIPAGEYAALRAWIRTLDAAAPSPAGCLSMFEQTAAAALWWFAQSGVDVAVVEVGMGGLRDATNVFGPPDGSGAGRSLVQCICPVDADHVGFIGDTVEEIAREKAGIMRPGSWIIIANQDRADAFHKIRQIAHRTSPGRIINVRRQPSHDIHVPDFSIRRTAGEDAPVRPPVELPTWAAFKGTGSRCLRLKYPPSLDTYTKPGHHPPRHSSHDASSAPGRPADGERPAADAPAEPRQTEVDLPLALPGYYQAGNASVAFYALDVLRTEFGFDRLTDATIQIGFQNVRWPGRLSWLSLAALRAARLDALTSASPCELAGSAVSSDSAPNFEPITGGGGSGGGGSGGGECSAFDASDSLDNWILADGAHNEPAAVELRKYVDTTLRRISQQRYIRATRARGASKALHVRWIVGFTAGKDVAAILARLVQPGDALWTVPFSQPSEMPWIRCEAPDAIARAAAPLPGAVAVENFALLADVLDRLAADASDDHLNVLCGSLYLVADLFRGLEMHPF